MASCSGEWSPQRGINGIRSQVPLALPAEPEDDVDILALPTVSERVLALSGARPDGRRTGERAGRTAPTRAALPLRSSRPPVRRQRRRLVAAVVSADATAVALTVAALPGASASPRSYAYGVSILLILAISGGYRLRMDLKALHDVPRLGYALLLPLVPFLVQDATSAAVTGLLQQLAVSGGTLLAGRTGTYGAIRALRRRGRYCEATAIVGSGGVGQELSEILRAHPEYGLEPVGFIDSVAPREPGDGDPLPVLGPVQELVSILERADVHRVIVAFGPIREADWVGVLRTTIGNDVEVHIVPRFFDIGLCRSSDHDDVVWGIPLDRVRRTAIHTAPWRLKRMTDRVVSGVALLVLAPVMAGIAVAVRLSSPGPVLFRQPRLGQHGQEFEMLKFRSIRQEQSSHTSNRLDGVTVVGQWLRRLSLDELPQLWNVFRGDMSLIGPRPERPFFVRRYSMEVPGYGDRHRLPTGLTGLAQVHGLRGETSIRHRARFDNAYIEGWSPWLDVTILILTVTAVVRDSLGSSRRRMRADDTTAATRRDAPADGGSRETRSVNSS